ncbi:hypothetical protein [Rhodoferax sp.]|uniref:hypothetical protein n=1 Tax=Rhodoferax sp. TaxID=50421 RepID=UPI002732C87E|nr:hypothetical protein [Rhodoferax sp.]MDP3190361.1 hypothetical protein [Rhodoferax sp.]
MNKEIYGESVSVSSHPVYVYIARLKVGTSSGIRAKVLNTVDSIRRQGRACRADIVSSGGLGSVFKFIMTAVYAKEDVLIIRSDHYSMLLLAPVMLFKRLMGKIVIFDIANPVRVSYRETWARNEPVLMRLTKLSILLLSYPVAFFPAHRIHEYGNEGWLASLGVRRKIVLVGNAANTRGISYRTRVPPFEGTQLVFGMAGHVAYFHGVDRFIRSMASYLLEKKGADDCVIRLNVVGGGFEINTLKKLSQDLGVAKYVEFIDEVPLSALEGFFDAIHVGLCSLAQCRKGIYLNSDLKSRDMAARGVPFVLAIEDPDFRSANLDAIYIIPNDESIIDLNKIIKWYGAVNEMNRLELRKFAVEKLDFDAKVAPIINFAEGKLC